MSRAIVKAVEPRTTKSGNKPYWRIQLEPGGWGSTFSASVGKICQENIGAELEVTTKKDGEYLNIDSAKLPAGAAAGPASQRDSIISRQVALKAAVEIAAREDEHDRPGLDSHDGVSVRWLDHRRA